MWQDRIAFGCASRIISRRAPLAPVYPRRRSLSCSGSSAPKWICWRTSARVMRYCWSCRKNNIWMDMRSKVRWRRFEWCMADGYSMPSASTLERGALQYYDADGHLLPRAFLAAPLKFDRISSTFDLARPDPVTGVLRPHEAIDFQAPQGTPVVAIGSATVEFAGWRPGYGLMVELKHAGRLHLELCPLVPYRRGDRRRAPRQCR